MAIPVFAPLSSEPYRHRLDRRSSFVPFPGLLSLGCPFVSFSFSLKRHSPSHHPSRVSRRSSLFQPLSSSGPAMPTTIRHESERIHTRTHAPLRRVVTPEKPSDMSHALPLPSRFVEPRAFVPTSRLWADKDFSSQIDTPLVPLRTSPFVHTSSHDFIADLIRFIGTRTGFLSTARPPARS